MALNIMGAVSKATGLIGGGSKSPTSSVFSLLDPTSSRLSASGLFPGGSNSTGKRSPTVGFTASPGVGSTIEEEDWRVRISLADKANILYRDTTNENQLLAPLIKTNGVIFPYTPSISIQHLANYQTATLTHSNYPAHFYNYSEVSDITITGEFTVQSESEGQYLMAVIYFFRAATKMFFGTGEYMGNPPPMVFLDGYGSHYLPHVPCVISNFTHTLPNEVDYLQVPITSTTLEEVAIDPADAMNSVNPTENRGVNNVDVMPSIFSTSAAEGGSAGAGISGTIGQTRSQYKTVTTSTRLPTSSQVSITLKPVYSRKNLHERFDHAKFASGRLLQDKDLGFGGFL